MRAARLSYGLARSLPGLAASVARPRLPLVDQLLGRDSKVVLAGPGFRAPATPFNRSVSPHRRWAFCSLAARRPQARSRTRPGCTLNDVVMALSTGALRRG